MTLQIIYKKALEQYEKENLLSNYQKEQLLSMRDNNNQKIEDILGSVASNDFSFAVNSITGWEVIEFGVEGDKTYPWFHTACKVPHSDLFIDVKGMRTEAEILSEYEKPKNDESYYAVKVDPEALYFCDNKPLELLASFLIGRDSSKLLNNT